MIEGQGVLRIGAIGTLHGAVIGRRALTLQPMVGLLWPQARFNDLSVELARPCPGGPRAL